MLALILFPYVHQVQHIHKNNLSTHEKVVYTLFIKIHSSEVTTFKKKIPKFKFFNNFTIYVYASFNGVGKFGKKQKTPLNRFLFIHFYVAVSKVLFQILY